MLRFSLTLKLRSTHSFVLVCFLTSCRQCASSQWRLKRPLQQITSMSTSVSQAKRKNSAIFDRKRKRECSETTHDFRDCKRSRQPNSLEFEEGSKTEWPAAIESLEAARSFLLEWFAMSRNVHLTVADISSQFLGSSADTSPSRQRCRWSM